MYVTSSSALEWCWCILRKNQHRRSSWKTSAMWVGGGGESGAVEAVDLRADGVVEEEEEADGEHRHRARPALGRGSGHGRKLAGKWGVVGKTTAISLCHRLFFFYMRRLNLCGGDFPPAPLLC